MRWLVLLLSITFSQTAFAQTVDAKLKAQAQGFVRQMAAIEAKAKTVEPMFIALQGRTAAQDKEMMRRIELLDNLYHKEVVPLHNQVSRAQFPLALQPVKDASQALDDWVKSKLTLQNAGVNNPSLEALKKKEPIDRKTYQEAFIKAQSAAK